MDLTQNDLPLMANTSHMRVRHYTLDLDVNFESQILMGSVVLFLEPGNSYKKGTSELAEACPLQLGDPCRACSPVPCSDPVTQLSACSCTPSDINFAAFSKSQEDTSDKKSHNNKEHASGSNNFCGTENHGREDFVLVLDCCDLAVSKVEEVDITAVPGIEKFTRSTSWTDVSEEAKHFGNQIVHELVTLPADSWREQHDYYSLCSQAPSSGELLFDTGTWSLQVKKPGYYTPTDFPHAIRIWYKTKPEGRSVRWTKDQSNRPCVYTIGSNINNRSLFPCQEPPVAMSTWQATIRAPEHYVVLMSGENAAEPEQCREGLFSWFYYVTMPMPASTFTIAVGCWTQVEGEACTNIHSVCLPSLHPSDDCSPHIVFLSQSVLSGRGNLCGTRVCHEIAHAWFGLAIGARDWTEEWLSEGFATYLEDVFWAKVQELSHEDAKDQCELKALLRWRRLRDEVANSEEELQVLRPNRENTGEVADSGASMVKHGLNPEKNFMQVHYLKGYFLLRHLASKIGEATYFKILRKFVKEFHGQLVLSQDFLHMVLENVPEHKGHGQSVEIIYQNWLDTAGIPKPLLEESHDWTRTHLAQQVKQEITKWIHHSNQRSSKGSKRRRKNQEECVIKLLPDQLVLLLECLLEEKTLCPRTLQRLEKTYGLREQDAEVRHRWCELVVKHKYMSAYGEIEHFLQEDQAMGVYLYGELMVNEDAKQQELARKCFAAVQNEMDVSSVKVVEEMLF